MECPENDLRDLFMMFFLESRLSLTDILRIYKSMLEHHRCKTKTVDSDVHMCVEICT